MFILSPPQSSLVSGLSSPYEHKAGARFTRVGLWNLAKAGSDAVEAKLGVWVLTRLRPGRSRDVHMAWALKVLVGSSIMASTRITTKQWLRIECGAQKIRMSANVCARYNGGKMRQAPASPAPLAPILKPVSLGAASLSVIVTWYKYVTSALYIVISKEAVQKKLAGPTNSRAIVAIAH